MEKEHQITFLSIAISDTQELIRFIDTKTAIVITILGSYLVCFFVSMDKIVQYSEYYSFGFWFFLTIFSLLLIACILITTRIIKPTNNPIDNIDISLEAKPNLKFYLAPNKQTWSFIFHNSSKFKLQENFDAYYQLINNCDENEVTKSLTFELFKISFIRNIKNERFNWLLKFLIITTIVFLIDYLFFSIETQNAIEILEMLKNYKK